MTIPTRLAMAPRRRRAPPARIKIKGIQGGVATFGSPGPNDDVWRRQLKIALGTSSDAFLDMTLHQLFYAAQLNGQGPSEMAINAAIAMIGAAAPDNEIVAALAVQMAVTHMVAMAMMARIGGAGGFASRLPGLASASAKLLRAYFGQVETLRRLRGGGGDQHIRVEHVHVHEGGQAMVGGFVSSSKAGVK
jgi:hypothetical protein